MADSIQRPTFYEAQILAAADLQGSVDYARDQLARHEHLLHSWGITEGLDVTAGDPPVGSSNKDQKEITISPGTAIDGAGRELVLLTSLTLLETDFTVGPAPGWYPVFLVGKDVVAPVTQTLTGMCSTGQASRINETVTYEFGRPGDELRLADQKTPTVGDGPDGGIDDDNPWKILLGYVNWGGKYFIGADPAPPGTTVTRKYTGVRADDVTARAGTLMLHVSNSATGSPVVALAQTKDGGELTFRLDGQTDPLFKVDQKGDLTIAGQLKTSGGAAIKPGQVLVESGTATDGTLLPLPNNIAPNTPGVIIRRIVTPRPPGASNPENDPTKLWGAFPLECSVDADGRVTCTTRWFRWDPTLAQQKVEDHSSSCNFVVIAIYPLQP